MIIVTFKERVQHDYNCRYKVNAHFSQRFDTQQEADEAAKEWVKTIPPLPYRREAIVHKGNTITTELNYWLESKFLKYALTDKYPLKTIK